MTDRPSGLIIPGMPQAPRAARHKGGDFCTLEQANNIAGNLIGPVAIVVEEMMSKIARCEDKLGITNETVAAEEKTLDDQPVGTAPRTMLLLRVILGRLDEIEQRLGMRQAVVPETPPEVVTPSGGDVE